MSRAYGIPNHHLVKVVQRLVEEGFLFSVRGRRGGLRLQVNPGDITVGKIVRMTEPHLNLVECFELRTNTCPIERACGLKLVLQEAQGAFLGALDGHTLADFLPRAPALVRLWKVGPTAAL